MSLKAELAPNPSTPTMTPTLTLTDPPTTRTRAQVWEDTAAQYVSLKAELAAVAALATRWRRLELASWRGTLARVASAHAAGAHHGWFHLYLLLMMGHAGGSRWGRRVASGWACVPVCQAAAGPPVPAAHDGARGRQQVGAVRCRQVVFVCLRARMRVRVRVCVHADCANLLSV